MDPEDINKALQDLGFLEDLENAIDASNNNSGQENLQEGANTSNCNHVTQRSEDQVSKNKEEGKQETVTSTNNDCVDIDLPRSEGQVSKNKEEGQQENVTSTNNGCVDIDLQSYPGPAHATFANPVDDPLNPVRALLHETQDAAEIIAESGPDNMLPEANGAPPESILILSTEPETPVKELNGDAQMSKLHQDRGPLFEPNLIVTTNPATVGNNPNNPDPMGRVVHEIFKFIFESNSMLTRGPQLSEKQESMTPPSEPNQPNNDNDDPVAILMAFLILLFVTLSRESLPDNDLKKKST